MSFFRCTHFNPEGDCLFAGAQNTIKVYGWEPARTYDSLVMGWGKVADMVTSQQQQLVRLYNNSYSKNLSYICALVVDCRCLLSNKCLSVHSRPEKGSTILVTT